MTDRRVRPRVLVTRPSADSLPLADALQRRGFDVLLQPLLRIRATEGPSPDLSGVQALLFTSANGVRAFARRSDVRTLAVFAVGDATAAAAKAEGFSSVTSAGGNVDDLARLVAGRLDPAAGKLLHAAGSAVAGDLAGALGAAGFTIERVQLYAAERVESFDPSIVAALRDGGVDAALFFSPRSAASFVSVVRAAGLTEACRGVGAFCLSEAVAEAASAIPWRSVAIAPEPKQESLLATLERELTAPSTSDTASEDSADIEDLLKTGDATAVIDRFGGIRPMAAKLDVPVTTVQGWKGRGHIPENRFAAVRGAAAAHGVDLSSGPQPGTASAAPAAAAETAGKTADETVLPKPSEEAAPAATAAPAASTPRAASMGGSGVAWAALILAVVALAGTASYRYWSGFVGEGPPATTADLAARVTKLENASGPDAALRERMDRMDEKVDAVSRQFARLASSASGGGKAVKSVTAEVDTLRASVDALTRRITQSEQRASAAATKTDDSLTALRTDLAELHRTTDALEARISKLEKRRPVSGERIAALAVAAGQLETALDSGGPYGGALDGLVALADGDEVIKKAAAPLKSWAKTGVPTLAELAHRFEVMAPELRTPSAVSKGGNWLDRLRAKVLSLVNLRPIGKGGESSPVTRAERALARNDLAAAVHALDGMPGPAVAWLADARNRLAANAAVSAVRARIVDRLAAESRAAAAGDASASGADGHGTQ